MTAFFENKRSAAWRRGKARSAAVAAIVDLICLAALVAAAGCAAGGSKSSPPPSQAANAPAPAQLRALPQAPLPTPVQDPAVAALPGDEVLMLGGLDAHDNSRPNIDALVNGHEVGRGRLPTPLHDAAAVSLGDSVYFFGGGGGQGTSEHSSDRILKVDPRTGANSPAGTLPAPSADISAAVVGDTAYVVGGFTGSKPLNTIVAWRPGAPAQVVGSLPEPLRYAAVAAVAGHVVIAGGSTPTTASDGIFSFDPQTRQLRPIGRLPAPTTHAGAAPFGSEAIVVGGRGPNANTQVDSVLAVDSGSGAVRPIGRLPAPLSDAGVVSLPGKILVIGGRGQKGTQASLTQLSP